MPEYRITKEKQALFLDENQIPGVQSANFNYRIPAQYKKYLGINAPTLLPEGAIGGEFTINSLLISQDPFRNYLSSTGFNGFLMSPSNNSAESNNFAFWSGFVSSYSQSASLNSVVQINVNGNIFGNMGKLSSVVEDNDGFTQSATNVIDTRNTNYNLYYFVPGSISLYINEFEKAHLVGYSFNYEFDRRPVYKIGQKYPTHVKMINPVRVSCQFVLEEDQPEMRSVADFPYSPNTQNISLRLLDLKTRLAVNSYEFQNMTLTEESYAAGINGPTTRTVNFVGEKYDIL